MTYQAGSTILAADFNNFLGTNGTSAYASSGAAQEKVGALYGVGYADRGYGQSAVSQAVVSANTSITSTHWTNLRSMISTIATHQGTSTTLLPPSGELASGQTIEAHESSAPTSDAYDINGMIALIDTNRNTANVGSMTLTSNAHTVTRASTWGSGGSETINCTVDITWGSEDAARYFFNSGGEVRLVLSHSSTSGSQNQNWNTILSTGVGTITFSAHATARSGSSGSGSAIGYYELTGSNQTIYNGTNIGTGAYSANDVTVQAQRLSYTGTNGANGTGIRIVVSLVDQHSGTSDTVASGTALNISHYRATTYLTGISAPSYSTVDGF